jgi:protein SCO1/2
MSLLPTSTIFSTRAAIGALGAVVLAGGLVTAQKPADIKEVREQVAFDQKLGAKIPLELTFRDESGAEVQLAKYFNGNKPVLLTPVYYGCPMLCTQVLNSLVRAVRPLSLAPGQDFEILTYTINPTEEPSLAVEKREKYLSLLGREGAERGWHWVSPLPLPAGEPVLAANGEATGPGTDAIHALSNAVGFRYYYDRETGEYAHEPGFVVLTPDGRISKYFFGIDYSALDLRLALVEASEGKVGTVVDRILMMCFHYDPKTGKYGFALTNSLRITGVVFLAALFGFIFLQLRRDRSGTRMTPGGA